MKMYCLGRRDMKDKDYRAVQCGHAIGQYFLDHGAPEPEIWDNGVMIYLGVENEHSLKEWAEKLKEDNIKHSTFFEPDIGNQLTAISIIDEGNRFANLPLLR